MTAVWRYGADDERIHSRSARPSLTYITFSGKSVTDPTKRPRTDQKVVKCVFFATLLLLVLSVHLTAQSSDPGPLRFEVTPFIGYRTGISFPVEPHVTGMNPRVIINASPSYGLSFGVRLRNKDDLVEIRWAGQDSHLHSEAISPSPPPQRVVINQFHGDFSHEPYVQELPSWAKPFVLASVGATRASSSTAINFTRFSFGIGGGIRFYPSRHVGFKIEAEWLPVLVEPHGAFICGTGCIIHVGGTLSSQGEVFAGPILRF